MASVLINSIEVNQWVYFKDPNDPLLEFKAPNYNIEKLNQVYSLNNEEISKYIKAFLHEADNRIERP